MQPNSPQPVAVYPPDLPSPESPDELIRTLHEGGILALEPTAASLALVAEVTEQVQEELGVGRSWSAARSTPNPYGRLVRSRRALGSEPRYRSHICQVCRSLGLSSDTLVDAPRLRTITAGVEHDPDAQPVYLLHRDTWYGCPQAMIVAWIPLHAVRAEEVFAFYPRYFSRLIPNSSSNHDQTWWMREVGWHGRTDIENFAAPAAHPELGEVVRWGLEPGSILLFSAAQLHQTLPNPTPGDTRYSLDFRILSVGITEAPNVDNESKGEAARISEEFSPIHEIL